MKHLIFVFAAFLFSSAIFSQALEKHALQGFDSVQTGIPHGKIDTITYDSKTVGTNRRVG